MRNVHQRLLRAPEDEVGRLIDSLASPQDRLWPLHRWPAIRFDAPLPGATSGGHGPVSYTVESYRPGRDIRFRFTRPRGFDGTHAFEVEPDPRSGGTYLRHVIEMRTRGPARLTWPLLFRPLHDALLEDALDCAERATGTEPPPRRWSPWVRVLRRAVAPHRRRRLSSRDPGK